MAHYDDIILPLGMSLGSSIGPMTSTQQLITTSGKRKTNKRWTEHLQKFDVGFNVKSSSDVFVIIDIFQAVDGPFGSFLARAWNDWNTTAGLMEPGDETFITNVDEPLINTVTGLNLGDGSTTTFKMVREYTGSSATALHQRDITKKSSLTCSWQPACSAIFPYVNNQQGLRSTQDNICDDNSAATTAISRFLRRARPSGAAQRATGAARRPHQLLYQRRHAAVYGCVSWRRRATSSPGR